MKRKIRSNADYHCWQHGDSKSAVVAAKPTRT
jgi:hypothetical protein